MLQKYLAKVKDRIKKFDSYKVWHVPKEENVQVDILSKLASTKPRGNNKSLIQVTLKIPSIEEAVSALAIEGSSSWVTLIIQHLYNGTLPHDFVKSKKIEKEASYYKLEDNYIGGVYLNYFWSV